MSRFMEHIHIGRFGALEDYQIGPFERGLNVVYGEDDRMAYIDAQGAVVWQETAPGQE